MKKKLLAVCLGLAVLGAGAYAWGRTCGACGLPGPNCACVQM